MELTDHEFGTTENGERVTAFRLAGDGGVAATIINWGVTLTLLELPDRDGQVQNCVLGYDTLAQYEAGHCSFGSTIGRYAGRIAGSRFTLDGTEYRLVANHGPHQLHGGPVGFSRRVWRAEPLPPGDAVGVVFRLTSEDGDQGFPGTLDVQLTCSLSADNELKLEYRATTDKPTHVNFTNHSYFNLAGHDSGNVHDHELTIFADKAAEINDDITPTGRLIDVVGSPLDFTQPKRIGADIDQAPLLYDHSFMVRQSSDAVPLAARLVEPRSGRVIEALSTEPVLQLYTAAHLKDERGIGGAIYQREQGVCLETEHMSDTPNQPHFPSTVLRPGETFQSTTVYRFCCLKPQEALSLQRK